MSMMESEDPWIMTSNKFPYSSWLQHLDNVEQVVVWTGRKSMAEFHDLVKKILPQHDFCSFRPDIPLSIPLWHAHVFVRIRHESERESLHSLIDHDLSG
jgi:hypothetical protein